jgi:hypothetical protein
MTIRARLPQPRPALSAAPPCSGLAPRAVLPGQVPPFQLTAMCLGIGRSVGLARGEIAGREPGPALRQPVGVRLLGVRGDHWLSFFSPSPRSGPHQRLKRG